MTALILSHQLWDCSYQIGGIYKRAPKLWSTGSAKLLATHFSSILGSPGKVGHVGLAFSELPAPSSDHTLAHNVRSIHMAQLVMDLCWRLILSMQKSDNCTNLAVGGRLYQCSHFLLVLCNNYCHHKTKTALHFSHIFPLYCYICAFSSDLSYHLWMQLELTFWMNLIVVITLQYKIKYICYIILMSLDSGEWSRRLRGWIMLVRFRIQQ